MREDWEEILYKDAVYKISTTKQKLKQKEYSQFGEYPIIDQGQEKIGGYSDDKDRILDCKLPVLVFGDHTKCVKLINFKFIPGADGTKVLEPKQGIEPKYISTLTHVLVHKIKDKGYARHYQHIEKENLPLAPLPEQRAIVSKIEELFSDLDKGIADLKKAQDQLIVYRQAVLKKAFEGELTKSKDLLNKTKLKKIVRFSQGIQVPKPDQKLNFQKGDVRFLRIIDFTQGKDSPRFIKNPGVKYIVSSDDISMVRYGASTGHICTGINGAIANNIFRIIPTVQLENKFLFYFFKSPYFLEILKKRVKGVAMPAISFGLLNDIEINFTSDERQQNLIVKAIESRLSVCDKMEESINESLEKSKALRQSILKKAFKGTLLSKDEIEKCKAATDYETAAVLLQKIKNL